VFDHASVGSRNICMPLEWFEREHSFGEKNDLYIRHAFDLSMRVTRAALEHALLAPTQVDHVIFVSTTGLATPSLDARIANALGFRPDVKRTPIWGLGCAGGAAGLARAVEFAKAAPESHTLLIAVELCSLAFQPEDDAKLGAISASLFSDGAAAVIVGGEDTWNAPTPLARLGKGFTVDVLATESVMWPDSLDVMGWTIDERGLHVVMKREIPSAVQEWVKPALVSFLREQGMALSGGRPLAAAPRRRQGARRDRVRARPAVGRARGLARGPARARQHVVADLPLRAEAPARSVGVPARPARLVVRARARLLGRDAAPVGGRALSVQAAAILFVVFLSAQRLFELSVSKRHERALRARGAVEYGASHFPFIVAVHVLLLAGILFEVLVLGARPSFWWPRALAVFVAAQMLRYSAIRALGPYWNVRVLVVPKTRLVRTGPYKYLKHPNYVAVFLEVIAAPLMFGAWRTSLIVGTLNAIALFVRIRCEDEALASVSK
jgi:isoprenylcysteine carboxyl methyltransferase (ICMT) family protein YpbQ